MAKSKFWEKVNKCKHEWNPDYYETFSCANEYCNATEQHCLKCGVFKTECKCGFENGLSGHSVNRATRRNFKKFLNKQVKK